MIGSGTAPGRVAVSPLAEDSDPLLAFSNEPGTVPSAGSSPDIATQPVAPAEDTGREPSPDALASLAARVDQLERALEGSKKQVSSLKSEVATLVRALGDIKKARPIPSSSQTARSGMRAAAAVVGIVIGLGLGMFAWQYLASDAEVAIAAPTAVESSGPVAEAATPVDATPAPPAPVPIRASSPRVVVEPENTPINYVGTLSVDASPGGEVFLDRKSAGTAPVRLTNLRAGSHLIWVERDGYRRFTRVVQVPADRVTRVFANLEPLAER